MVHLYRIRLGLSHDCSDNLMNMIEKPELIRDTFGKMKSDCYMSFDQRIGRVC